MHAHVQTPAAHRHPGPARMTLAALAGVLAGAVSLAPAARPADAQTPRDRLVVEPDELAARLGDPNLVLLHVGQEEQYAEEHLPGAVFVSLSDLSAAEDHDAGTGLSLEMPAPEKLAASLEALGIGDESEVVVYYGDDWVTPAARVLFTLDWIGLGERSGLLDGGMRLWKEKGHPVTAEVPAVTPGDLTPRPREDRIVAAEWVDRHRTADGYRVIDARAPVHYDGIQPTYLHREPVRKGHIPGAANVPFSEIVDEDLRIRPEAELRELFRAAGVEEGDTVVGYCHLGQYATLMLFGARTLGYDIRLYDGSFQEWGSRPELPVEGPGADR